MCKWHIIRMGYGLHINSREKKTYFNRYTYYIFKNVTKFRIETATKNEHQSECFFFHNCVNFQLKHKLI